MISSLGYHLLKFVLDLSSQEYTSDTKLRTNVRNEIALASLWTVERVCPCVERLWLVDTQGEKCQLLVEEGRFNLPRARSDMAGLAYRCGNVRHPSVEARALHWVSVSFCFMRGSAIGADGKRGLGLCA